MTKGGKGGTAEAVAGSSGLKSGPGRSGPDRPGRGWFKRAELAELFGVSEQQFDRKYRRLIPESEIRNVGKWVFIRGRAAIDAHVQELVNRASSRDDDDGELLGGKYKDRIDEEKYLRLRMDRLEREKQLLPRDEVRAGMLRLATILKGVGEALGRDFGSGAQQLLDEGLDDFMKELEHSFE